MFSGNNMPINANPGGLYLQSMPSNMFNNLNQQQLALLHQQMQQQQHGSQEFNALLANAMHQMQQQQQQQQNMLNKRTSNFPNRSNTNALETSSPISSSFSVSSLLNNNMNSQQQHQQQQQQLAAAVLSQQIAAAVAGYRLQQQQQQQQILNSPKVNANSRIVDSAFQQPPASKKAKLNEMNNVELFNNHLQMIQNELLNQQQKQLNTSSCSISSPSSSSSTSSTGSSSLSLNEDHSNLTNHANINHHFQNEFLIRLNNFHSSTLKSANQMNSTEQFEHHLSGSSEISMNDSETNQHDQSYSEFDRSSPATNSNIALEKPQQKRRSNRKRISIDLKNLSCPICGITLRPVDLKSHLETELERLEKINNFCHIFSDCRDENIDSKLSINHHHDSSGISSDSSPLPKSSNSRKRTSSGNEKLDNLIEVNFKSRYSNYLKIKETRTLRLKSKLRLRMKVASNQNSSSCPSCSQDLTDLNEEQVDFHFEQCAVLKNDSNNTSDLSDHQQYETYEWAGQKRIRPISMLNNPAKEIGATSITREEFDGELNVDTDEAEQVVFGKPQFNESDLIPIKSDDKSDEIIRQAIIESEENSNETSLNEERDASTNEKNKSDNKETSRCLICMDTYTNALVSVNCWHVYCKQCWLQSLGAKKLCPQCNVITSPKDLRRIFL